MIEDAGTQVVEDAPHRPHRALAHFERRVDVAAHDLVAREPLAQPVQFELHRGQGSAQLVVDVAGDVRALFLAHRVHVRGQPAQAIARLEQMMVGLRQLGGPFGDPALEFSARRVQRGLGVLAFGDVGEGYDRPDHDRAVADGIGRVRDRERSTVAPPKHLVLDMAAQPLPVGSENPTFVH